MPELEILTEGDSKLKLNLLSLQVLTLSSSFWDIAIFVRAILAFSQYLPPIAILRWSYKNPDYLIKNPETCQKLASINKEAENKVEFEIPVSIR